tara:strand:- start:19710 stop:20513 length:804 start_codon:yes stop_codon:yes gene_type:complete
MQIYTNIGFLKEEYSATEEEAEAIFLGAGELNPDDFPNAKIVYRMGVGVENLKIFKDSRPDVKLFTPNAKIKRLIFDETANFACYLILRSLFDHSYNFQTWTAGIGRKSLENTKLLVLGAGNIGTRVFYKMKQFMDVEVFDPKIDSTLPKDMKSFDVVSIHIPASPENDSFIDENFLNLLNDNAILVNTSRGSVVDEDALYSRMKTSNVKAYFDVFWQEPYSGKLLELYPNKFFATPHASSSCIDFFKLAKQQFLEILIQESIKHEL